MYSIVMATTGKKKLNESSRWDWDITETKKPLRLTGALKSCYIMPEYGRCEDNNVDANKLALLQTKSIDKNTLGKSNGSQSSSSQS